MLTDFWFNHFNVFAGKGPERIMLTEYERDVIRPHVLGSFRDLLGATAHSPAMLFYLDNWMSTDPDGVHSSRMDDMRQRNRARLLGRTRPDLAEMMKKQQKNRPTGLNENYGRELMELHTLGVDGGYTQKDVVEVARCLTGWTIAQPRQGGGYRFDPRMHDDGEKHVLGHTIKAGGGEKDGEQVLDILARHPSTAKFISTKLARRFVGDERVEALSGHQRRPPGSRPHYCDVARILCAGGVPREGEDAVRIPGQRAASGERGRSRPRWFDPGDATARHAALPGAAAHRLRRHGRGVGEHRRVGKPDELRAVAGAKPRARRAGATAGGSA